MVALNQSALRMPSHLATPTWFQDTATSIQDIVTRSEDRYRCAYVGKSRMVNSTCGMMN